MGANGSGKELAHERGVGPRDTGGGRIAFDGADITKVPTYHRLARGLAHVLERRRPFRT